MRRVISTQNAPQAIGTYSQGIKAGRFVFTSGQAGIDPQTGELVRGDFAEEVRLVLRNLAAILDGGGSSLAEAVKITVFLTDLSNFPVLNTVFAEFFKEGPPARSTVQVTALPLGANVEIEAVGIVQ